MKHIIALQLFFICGFAYGQNFQISKIAVDKNTHAPLENVIVFNNSDYSTTTAEGKFIFVSQNNEINLNLLGYNSIKSTFDKLQNGKDTIFMELKAFQLKEVVVNNGNTIYTYMKKVYEKSKENELQNYTVSFFLRNVFKKDSVHILLQDIYARKNQNIKKRKNLIIELYNMRKTSVFEKQNKFSFTFPNFNDLFSNVVAPLLDICNFKEIPFNDSDFKKVLFVTKEKDDLGQIWKGYFIINRKDYAIVEYTLSIIDDPEKIPYKELKSEKFRTIKWKKFVQFTKDQVSNKYYLSNLKLDNQVEILVNEIDAKPFNYDFTMDFFATNSPSSEEINSNFAVDKDIFRAEFPYSREFWINQNQLPLTTELEMFLQSVIEKKDQTKDYEIISNF
jgi:hypothetical protein